MEVRRPIEAGTTGLRQLPSVERLVSQLQADDLPRALVVTVARSAIDQARSQISHGIESNPTAEAAGTLARLRAARPTRVINATGVLLHTNLGRAHLSPEAATAATEMAVGYGNVELDLLTGDRGGRATYVEELLCLLTGAEAAAVVNNNAAALLLGLAALAAGRSVPVSRGELIEIGGSYRLPDLMTASGARLMEVGTTNRTRLSDYRQALDADTALLLKVHPSNYRIEGFVATVELSELAMLAGEHRVPLLFDAGSGLLDQRTPWLPGPPPPWLAGEPGIRQSLEAGADLVMFSGDKLLGGPQAGLLVGRSDLVERLRRHPIARALRVDGPTLAALSVTLEVYASGDAAQLPFWRQASLPSEVLAERARLVLQDSGVDGEIREGVSLVGAGSVPGAEVPSPQIVVGGAEDRFGRLLGQRPAVLARRNAGDLVLDLRAVQPTDDGVVSKALAAVCRS